VTLPGFVPTVRRVERAVGAPLERAIARGQGIDALVFVSTATRRGRRAVTRVQDVAIHLMDLPTRRDVRSAALARLEAKVEELAERLDEEEESR
jgi:hypothetical protein